MRDRPLLIGGTWGGERVAAERPGPDRDWHLPPHARDPRDVRERTAQQVAAGADVLLAHTFLTHRRALSRVGEARRAADLTRQAVSVARGALEEGLDGRAEAAARSATDSPESATDSPESATDVRESDAASPGAPWEVLIAGVLPAIGSQADPATGRLGERESVAQRDLHDHAALLAEAGVDLILVERAADAAATALALRAAVQTGLTTWATLPSGLDADALERWCEAMLPLGPALLLIGGSDGAAATETLGRLSGSTDCGVLLDDVLAPDTLADHAASWLSAGSRAIGLADGATPERIASLRSAVDERMAALRRASDLADSGWTEWVALAAERAPNGRGAWIATGPVGKLPGGWQWSIVPTADVGRLPHGRFRLIVSREPLDAGALGERLEPGGVLLVIAPSGARTPEGLALLERGEVDGEVTLVLRREAR